MKKLHLIMLAGALAVSLNASAQFSNNASTRSGKTNYSGVITPTYDRFQISYVNEKISPDKGDDTSLNGVGLNWIHGISVSKNLPLYVQTGLDLHLGFWSDEINREDDPEDKTYQKIKLTTLNAAIPVNLAYKINASPSFSIEPLVGLNIKFNIISNTKNSIESESEWLNEKMDGWSKEELEEYFGFKESINNFDKKDTGSKEATWKRFQIGWHIGANFIFSKKYYAGITYGSDFMEIAKKTNSSTLTVGLGYIF